jgi:hypothetical protein
LPEAAYKSIKQERMNKFIYPLIDIDSTERFMSMRTNLRLYHDGKWYLIPFYRKSVTLYESQKTTALNEFHQEVYFCLILGKIDFSAFQSAFQYTSFVEDENQQTEQERISNLLNSNNIKPRQKNDNSIQYGIDQIISRFKNGEELYRNSPAFNMCVQQLLRGVSPYEIIENLCQYSDDAKNALVAYVKRDNRPVMIRFPDGKEWINGK